MKTLFVLVAILGTIPSGYLSFVLLNHRAHSSSDLAAPNRAAKELGASTEPHARDVIDYSEPTLPISILGFELEVAPLKHRWQMVAVCMLVGCIIVQLVCLCVLLSYRIRVPQYA